jgi:hypothetical protein
MSNPKQVIITRHYQGSADAMSRAVQLLLNKSVRFDSQAKRGDSHDLTNDPTQQIVKNGPRTTEQENT